MKITKVEKAKLRTWVELDKKAIVKNYGVFKKIIGKGPTLMGVVKSNAYGHGLVPFSKELVKLGIGFLGVDSFEEALELRKAGIKTRILVFGYVAPSLHRDASEKNISITISSLERLIAISKIKFKTKLKIHIKADTGLGRQGFLPKDQAKVLMFLRKLENKVEVEGLYSHFAVGEDLSKKAYTVQQAEILNKWGERFKEEGYKPLKHICATSSAMFFPELHFDMVRVGIGMYGLWPSKETKNAVAKKYNLHPVLSWKTIITEIKNLPKGSKVGYDLTEELERNSLLAVVPVGYWHGYPRNLSGKGIFCVNGKKAKVVGRVSMDMVVLDVTDIKPKVGDEVTIIENNNDHFASAEKMAQNANTINYEIVTHINPQIDRFLK